MRERVPSDGEAGEGAAHRISISRRGLLFLPLLLTVARLSAAAQTEGENLEYRDGRLHWSSGSAAAAVGRTGVKADKREGDGATPAGTFPLVSILYRPDRIEAPLSHLPVKPLAPSDGWVDEPTDANYNRPVSLPYPASAEQMWREDDLYDALVVIGYNMEPVVSGAGSAIFLHIATPHFAPTAGCVAVTKEILLRLLPLLGPGSKIAITG
jgi:L,D-peptidoglycan transpeptidase YkuD (ErfK/YbiS/YcfS/YnhG family)